MEITAFEPLADEIQSQSVPIGTTLSELNLPKQLSAVIATETIVDSPAVDPTNGMPEDGTTIEPETQQEPENQQTPAGAGDQQETETSREPAGDETQQETQQETETSRIGDPGGRRSASQEPEVMEVTSSNNFGRPVSVYSMSVI